MNDIGKKMYDRRKELNLTLEDVGKAVGVGKSTVRKWEQGMIKNMGRDKIASLAKVLQMNPVEFVPAEGQEAKVLSFKPRRLFATDALPKGVVRKDFPLPVYGTTTTKRTLVTDGILAGKPLHVVSVEEDPELRALLKMWKVATPERKKDIVRVIKAMTTKED